MLYETHDGVTTPVVIAHPDETGLDLWVHCPFCQQYHVHGNAPGHRTSHCFRGTYFLRIAETPLTRNMIDNMERHNTRLRREAARKAM